MFLEKQIFLLSNILNGYIYKLKITKQGSVEIFLKRDSKLTVFFRGGNVFFFNFYFANLVKNLTFFLSSSLADLLVVDYPSRLDRFDVIYNFLSIRCFFRFFIIVRTTAPFLFENNNVDLQFYVKSLTILFNSAFWLERECWDLFGVFFQDNNDLRRILTDYGFEGYPLRKDFPLTGFLEVRYDDEQRSVVYENLELSQEFRFFDFESPWELGIKNNLN
jgi:NADH:ubiquinone oxidoreductase subunit C